MERFASGDGGRATDIRAGEARAVLLCRLLLLLVLTAGTILRAACAAARLEQGLSPQFSCLRPGPGLSWAGKPQAAFRVRPVGRAFASTA